MKRTILPVAFAFVCLLSFGARGETAETGLTVFDRDGDIYTGSLNATGEMQLTKDGDSHGPKWSPDGQQILFIRNTSLQTVVDAQGAVSAIGQPTDFFLMNRDGSNSHLLKHLGGVVSDPSWSPDGKTIGFYYQSKEEWLHQGIPAFTGGFYVLPADGEGEPRLVSSEARYVDWSPDGKRLVFAVKRPKNHWALHTANVDGGNEAQLLDEDVFIDADSAKWAPDSNQIAFRATVKRKMGDDDKYTFQGAIFIVQPDGTHLHLLTYDLGWDCWHPWWDHRENKLTYSCYTMPTCMPEAIKKHPDQCIARTFTLFTGDPHAKPNQVLELKGSVGPAKVPEVAP